MLLVKVDTLKNTANALKNHVSTEKFSWCREKNGYCRAGSMTKLSYGLMRKENNKCENVGLCYILSTTTLCVGGSQRGGSPRCTFHWVDLPMVLCMNFTHGFGHDVFMSMVFCRFGQGNYDYVLIQG